MPKNAATYLLVSAWILIVGLSFWAATTIDGPRNLDTGFKRLDLFLKYQLAALIVAIAAAIAGFRGSHGKWQPRLIGLVPLTLTVTVLTGLFIFASLQNHNTSSPQPVVSVPATGVVD
ncbi:MAG: hypothetical protein AAF404_12120 [Pseudomonadota bacterium]